MTVFGWLLILGGLGWLALGVGNIGSTFMVAVNAQSEVARHAASQTSAIALLFNGLLFIFPGLVVAGIGGLLVKRGRRNVRMEEAPAGQRLPCPACAEMILVDAKVCRFCGHKAGAVNAPDKAQ